MLKQDLVNTLCETTEGYLKRDIGQVVDIALEAISEALANGDRVEIRGFGSFAVRKRAARTAKNPKTGRIMNIPPRRTIHFAMSKSLKETLVKAG
jgi:nucleoid DNA-binding protein